MTRRRWWMVAVLAVVFAIATGVALAQDKGASASAPDRFTGVWWTIARVPGLEDQTELNLWHPDGTGTSLFGTHNFDAYPYMPSNAVGGFFTWNWVGETRTVETRFIRFIYADLPLDKDDLSKGTYSALVGYLRGHFEGELLGDDHVGGADSKLTVEAYTVLGACPKVPLPNPPAACALRSYTGTAEMFRIDPLTGYQP